jgi:hypothetical protein
MLHLLTLIPVLKQVIKEFYWKGCHIFQISKLRDTYVGTSSYVQKNSIYEK